MKALEVNYIINIKMEMTNVELEEIAMMAETYLEDYRVDENHDCRDTVSKLKEILSKVREFDYDSNITPGHF